MKYIVNNLDHNLSLKTGYLNVPAKGYKILNEGDETEVSIVYAIGRKWATITNVEPEAVEVNTQLEITTISPYEGMTEAELLASFEEEKKDKVVTGVTVTAIGADEDMTASSEAKPKKSGKSEKAEKVAS